MSRAVSRVEFIEIKTGTAWMVEGTLWNFRYGAQLAVGDANDFDSEQPMVTQQVAMSLINAGKAEAMSVTELDGVMELEMVDLEEAA